MISLRQLLCRLVVTGAASASNLALAQTSSPFQNTLPNYFGSSASSVYLAGTDTKSAAFQTVEPTYLSTVTSKLREGVAFTGNGLNQLDPKRLYFVSAYAPRVYFLYGNTGSWNELGATIGTVATPTTGATVGTTYTVFSNCQSATNPFYGASGIRSRSYPLYPGDFVQLPTVNAGQQLALYLASTVNSSGVPANVTGYTGTVPGVAYNGVSPIDNYQHEIAFFPDTSQYIIIGFEDWFGPYSDRDCNDCVVVVDVGAANTAAWSSGTSLPK